MLILTAVWLIGSGIALTSCFNTIHDQMEKTSKQRGDE